MKLEAIALRDHLWAVRPEGSCGTCGWVDGKPWSVVYVKAKDSKEAVKKVLKVAKGAI